MGHVEQARQVGIHHLSPLGWRHLVKHRVAGDTGVVHQHLYRTQRRLHLRHARHTGVIVGDRPFEGGNTGLSREFRRSLIIPGIVGSDGIARRLQRHGNGRTNTARPTCHQCHSAHYPLPRSVLKSCYDKPRQRARMLRGDATQTFRSVPDTWQHPCRRRCTALPAPFSRRAGPFQTAACSECAHPRPRWDGRWRWHRR